MSHRKPARAGLVGRAFLTLLSPLRYPAESDLLGSAALFVAPHKASALGGMQMQAISSLVANNEEFLLDGPLVGTIGDRDGESFLFDNRGEASSEGGSEFSGITVRSEGVVVKNNARDIGFSGPDQSVEVSGDRVTIRVPPLVFNPTFAVRFVGGPFNNQSVAEKGYQATALAIVWASNNAADIPIQSYDQLTLGGAAIALDVGSTVSAGGTFTPGSPLSEAATGAGASVRLHSAISSVTKSAKPNWHYRIHFGNSLSEILDESGVKGLSNSQLQGSRIGTLAFAASAGTYKWISYPVSYGLADPDTKFIDAVTNLNVPMNDPSVISITNAFGHTADYYAYRSVNKINGALSVRVD